MWHKVDLTLCNSQLSIVQSLDVAYPLLYDCLLPILIDQLQGHQLQMLLHFPIVRENNAKKIVSCVGHVVWLYDYWCCHLLTWIFMILGKGCFVFDPPSIASPQLLINRIELGFLNGHLWGTSQEEDYFLCGENNNKKIWKINGDMWV